MYAGGIHPTWYHMGIAGYHIAFAHNHFVWAEERLVDEATKLWAFADVYVA